MPLKQRNVVIDLGVVDAGDASPEVDLSSMTHCVLYIDPAGSPAANFSVHIQFCPLPIGEDADDTDWYDLYGTSILGQAKMTVQWTYHAGTTGPQVGVIPISGLLIPGTTSWYGYLFSMPAVPRRVRFQMPTATGFDSNLTVEAMRSIG